MIVWIEIQNQGTRHPTLAILATTFPVYDSEGKTTKVRLQWWFISLYLQRSPGVTSLTLFWTYVEIGVGFIVACLPPCARLLDQVTIRRVLTKLRSLPSIASMTSWARGTLSISGPHSQDIKDSLEGKGASSPPKSSSLDTGPEMSLESRIYHSWDLDSYLDIAGETRDSETWPLTRQYSETVAYTEQHEQKMTLFFCLAFTCVQTSIQTTYQKGMLLCTIVPGAIAWGLWRSLSVATT